MRQKISKRRISGKRARRWEMRKGGDVSAMNSSLSGSDRHDVPMVRSACIVVPTYNESGNISNLLDLVFRNVREPGRLDGVEVDVLVVDDSSPDGTADVVRGYMKKDRHVHLLVRAEKQGLGAAYIAGMQHAMSSLKPDVVMEMDADLSHDPADVPRLINAVRDGADFVIGSRYVSGGSVPADWGFHRKIISSSSNMMTRMILGNRGVRDCTGGFRAIRTSLLGRIDFDGLDVKGYAFQAVLLNAAMRAGGVVKEVPISFADRTVGKSKMTVKDLLEGGMVLLKTRWRSTFGRNRHFAKVGSGVPVASDKAVNSR